MTLFNSKLHGWLLWAVVVGITAMAGRSEGSETAARAVLDEAAAKIAGASSLRLESKVTYSGRYSDSEETMTTEYAFAVNRDGDIAVHVANESLETYLFLSGDSFIQYMPEFEQYSVRPRDHSVARIMEMASFEIIDPVVNVFSSLAQFKSPAAGFVIRDLALLEPETIDGRACDRIRFTLNGVAYTLWVEEAPGRLIRRIEPDMSALEAEYQREYGMEFDIRVVADVPTWELDADVSSALQFTPPDGAEEVERFGPKQPAEKMVGEEAPDFTLPLLDGGTFTLSESRGSVVILDFWATWCGPCRIAMPVLSAVSKEFADQGVKLVSVDLDEDPADVRAFLESMDLDITVALSSGETVPMAYKVSGIPQTTIVGRDGVIRAVHVGLWAMPEVDPEATEDEQMAAFHTALADALRKQLAEIAAE